MENMNQLKDLLKHEIKDLYSAEEQIIEALPKMIEKANNKKLKDALQSHFTVTETHKERLDQVLELLEGDDDENKGFLSGLFKNSKAGEKCKAMEGILSEGEKMMGEDMSPEVSDAAIIGAAQKVEHYEITSYGTARAYAQELNLNEVEALLRETLDEEYEADDLLTQLAESRINLQAIDASSSSNGRSGGRKPAKASNGRSRLQAASNARNETPTRRGASAKRGKTSSNGSPKKTSGGRSAAGSSRGKKTSRGRSGNR